jgi:hypothetical protein
MTAYDPDPDMLHDVWAEENWDEWQRELREGSERLRLDSRARASLRVPRRYAGGVLVYEKDLWGWLRIAPKLAGPKGELPR